MASRGKGARAKGAGFEREIAKILTAATGYEFKRGLGQARGGGGEIADVTCSEIKNLHFELKCQQRPNIAAAFEQAKNDAPDKTKVVITKADRCPTMVTMELEEWLPMLKAWLALNDIQKTISKIKSDLNETGYLNPLKTMEGVYQTKIRPGEIICNDTTVVTNLGD